MSGAVRELLTKREEMQERRRALLVEVAAVDADLAALDRVLRLLNPAYAPADPPRKRRKTGTALNGLFADENVTTLVLEALRTAESPMTSRDCAEVLAARKQVSADDERFPDIVNRISSTLGNLASRSRVRRTAVNGREVLWEVAR